MGCEGFTQLFAFPSNEDEKEIWLKELELNLDATEIGSYHRLCDLHFDPKYIKERILQINTFSGENQTTTNTQFCHFQSVFIY